MFIRRTENNLFTKWWLGVDKFILFSVLALIVFGILIQFAASPYQARRMKFSDEYHFIKNIGVYMWFGLFIMISVSTMKLQSIRKWTIIGFPVLCLMLVATLFFTGAKGATRWINLGFMKIQPSELLKPFFAIAIAMILVRIKDLHKMIKDMEKKNGMDKKRKIFFPIKAVIFTIQCIGKFCSLFSKKEKIKKPMDEYSKLKKRRKNYCLLLCCILGFICAVLIKQPDFGMTITYLVIFFAEILVAGLPWKIFFIFIAMASGIIPFAYKFFPHFFIRINKFLMDDNYQLDKALDAIKESNLLFGGHANNLKTIVPDIHTDFIFAAVIEEFGPILSILLILLFLILIIHILYKLKSKENSFVIFSGIGISSYITFQITYNLISTLGIGPTKGMTLPFISYGGSSFCSSCLAIGIILSLLQDQNLRR